MPPPPPARHPHAGAAAVARAAGIPLTRARSCPPDPPPRPPAVTSAAAASHARGPPPPRRTTSTASTTSPTSCDLFPSPPLSPLQLSLSFSLPPRAGVAAAAHHLKAAAWGRAPTRRWSTGPSPSKGSSLSSSSRFSITRN